jgi:hypothetical protein
MRCVACPVCPHFSPSPHSPTKPSKRRCGASPRARLLTPDSLFLTDLIIHHDLTPRDLMHSLLVTARVVLLPLDRFQRSSHQPSQRKQTSPAIFPAIFRWAPVSPYLITLRHRVRTYNTLHKCFSGWLAAPPRQVPQGEPWRRFLLNRRSMNE